MNNSFYPLSVSNIEKLTEDCVKINFELNSKIKQHFHFEPGQYLTLETIINGEKLRRNYSICNSPNENSISVAVKEIDNGKFSSWANNILKTGDIIDSLVPDGNFVLKNTEAQNYLFIAAGSGITPIFSMIKTLLEKNSKAQIVLIFGNKNTNSIIFREALEDLKNKYINNFQWINILSQEPGDSDFITGRIDLNKMQLVFNKIVDPNSLEGIYMCGPSAMIMNLKDSFQNDFNIASEKIQFELFNTDDIKVDSNYIKSIEENAELKDLKSTVNIEVDGRNYIVELTYGGETILDAALKAGADLPFACKGGVCCTCRAKVLNGEVDMEKNFALEPEEVENGYVLTCQSHPKTPEVSISFDYR